MFQWGVIIHYRGRVLYCHQTRLLGVKVHLRSIIKGVLYCHQMRSLGVKVHLRSITFVLLRTMIELLAKDNAVFMFVSSHDHQFDSKQFLCLYVIYNNPLRIWLLCQLKMLVNFLPKLQKYTNLCRYLKKKIRMQ